uniref:Uncharacterized protein n=1 Tax=Romanomermis culicivorax TaxID=13658 RepID=A0A915HID7_ROMCU
MFEYYNTFMEYDPKFVHCYCHVKRTVATTGFIFLLISIACLATCLLGIFYPGEGQKLLEVEFLNLDYKKYEKNFRTFYTITLSIVASTAFVHIFTLILCTIGLKKIKPNFILAELIVMGLITFAVSFVLVASMMLSTSYYFYLLVYCYKYVDAKSRSNRKSRGRLVVERSKYSYPGYEF